MLLQRRRELVRTDIYVIGLYKRITKLQNSKANSNRKSSKTDKIKHFK